MLSRTLYECLISSDSARLEAIAERWGIDLPLTRRRDLATTLAEAMPLPQKLEATWDAVTEEEKAALAALQAAGGKIPWPTFTREWGEVRSMGPGRIARERPWDAPVSPAEGLWYWGLIYRIPDEGPTGMYEVAYIPEDLQILLPTASQPPTPHVEPAGTPPPVVRPAGAGLLDDACTLLAYVHNHLVRPGDDGTWPGDEESNLQRRLRDPAPGRLVFLRHLSHRLGWLRIDDGERLRLDPDPVLGWLQSPSFEQRSVLATAWREDPTWNDLWRVPTLQPDATGSWHNDPLLAREAVLRTLSACEPEAWYRLADYVAAIKKTTPDFQRPDGNYDSWYIRDVETGDYLRGFESWDAVEGTLIRYLITRPMRWLGLVDLGAEEEDGPVTAFRLSESGAAWLELAEAPVAPEAPALTLRPDLMIEVAAARRYDRFQLNRIADWVRSGDPYIYRMTAGSLARAKKQGIPIQRTIEFLEETTCEPVPPVLKTALGRWAREGTQVRLERVLVLRTKDPAALTELTDAPATRHLIGEVIGPTAALVARDDWPRLLRAIAEVGFLPELGKLEEE